MSREKIIVPQGELFYALSNKLETVFDIGLLQQKLLKLNCTKQFLNKMRQTFLFSFTNFNNFLHSLTRMKKLSIRPSHFIDLW